MAINVLMYAPYGVNIMDTMDGIMDGYCNNAEFVNMVEFTDIKQQRASYITGKFATFPEYIYNTILSKAYILFGDMFRDHLKCNMSDRFIKNNKDVLVNSNTFDIVHGNVIDGTIIGSHVADRWQNASLAQLIYTDDSKSGEYCHEINPDRIMYRDSNDSGFLICCNSAHDYITRDDNGHSGEFTVANDKGLCRYIDKYERYNIYVGKYVAYDKPYYVTVVVPLKHIPERTVYTMNSYALI